MKSAPALIRLGSLALYAVVALVIALWAAPRTSLNPRALLPQMVEGTAYRPYVYRALVPNIVRGLDPLVPAAIRARVDAAAVNSRFVRERLRWEPEHATWFLWVLVLHWASLIGFGVCLQALVVRTFGVGEGAAALAAACGVLLTAIHFGYQNFIYDFPQLALFTLGLLLIQRGSLIAYYVLFPIGMLNKETFVLLAVAFAILQWPRLTRRSLALHLVAHAGIAVVVLIALHGAFRHNPGEPLEFHLARNLHYAPRPRQLFHDVVYWGFWLFALWGGRAQRALLGLALVLGAVLLGTTMFFGYFGEYRDYYEAFPVLCLLAFAGARRVLAGRGAAIGLPT